MTRTRLLLATISSILLLSLFPSGVQAQQSPGPKRPLRVFLDCHRCDFDYFRREVGFVDYVRDRTESDVHVLVTSQNTGSGGRDYTFEFIGQQDFAGREDTLQYVSGPDDTSDEVRAGMVHTFEMGLVGYVASTSVASDIAISYQPTSKGAGATSAEEDPWNLWVFRAQLSGSMQGETQQGARAVNGALSAGRTTRSLKVNMSARGSWSRQRFQLSDTTTSVFTSRNWGVDGSVVWSLGPRWSAGARATLGGSTRRNQLTALHVGPAIEFDLFPYAQSSHRQITFMYTIGLAAYRYEEVTLYGKTAETRPEHTLDISADFQRPWGDLYASLSGTNYLDNFAQHRIDFFTGISVRLTRGLSLGVHGSAARVENQIYEPRASVSEADILLQRRELGTSYRFSLNVGFSYTFGSVFNNVVNPRMWGGGAHH
jgi:hypothetical protein